MFELLKNSFEDEGELIIMFWFVKWWYLAQFTLYIGKGPFAKLTR